jgi:hypothetical protein
MGEELPQRGAHNAGADEEGGFIPFVFNEAIPLPV